MPSRSHSLARLPLVVVGIALIFFAFPVVQVLLGLSSPQVAGFQWFIGALISIGIMIRVSSVSWARRLIRRFGADDRANAHWIATVVRPGERSTGKTAVVSADNAGLVFQYKDAKSVIAWGRIVEISKRGEGLLRSEETQIVLDDQSVIEIGVMEKNGVLHSDEQCGAARVAWKTALAASAK